MARDAYRTNILRLPWCDRTGFVYVNGDIVRLRRKSCVVRCANDKEMGAVGHVIPIKAVRSSRILRYGNAVNNQFGFGNSVAVGSEASTVILLPTSFKVLLTGEVIETTGLSVFLLFALPFDNQVV